MQTDTPTTSAPVHCGRPMMDVLNRSVNDLPYNSPIWWCVECHYRVPRDVAEGNDA